MTDRVRGVLVEAIRQTETDIDESVRAGRLVERHRELLHQTTRIGRRDLGRRPRQIQRDPLMTDDQLHRFGLGDRRRATHIVEMGVEHRDDRLDATSRNAASAARISSTLSPVSIAMMPRGPRTNV